jgi:hypothetical protein
LSRLVHELDTHPEAVLAFCDHHVVSADGEFIQELTERYSRRWGRAPLKEGLQYSTCELAIASGSISTVVAALFRREFIDWSRIPDAVGPAYDVWMGYLACRSGLPAYYVSQRLSNYRVHPEMQTQTSRLHHALGSARAYSLIAEDPALVRLRAPLQHMCGLAELSAGIALLQSGKGMDARPHIMTALRMAPTPRGLLAMTLTWLAPQFAARVIKASRRARALRLSL